MSNLDPERLARFRACWDKIHYDTYLKVKDLPDDELVSVDYKTPEGAFLYSILSVGTIKVIAKDIEKRRNFKPE